MRTTVLLFALAREKAGAASVSVDLEDGATVADLKRALAQVCPALGPILPVIWIAIDAEYATDDQVIPPGAELAAIPPVSGG